MTDPTRPRAALLAGLAWVLVVAGLWAAPPLRNVDWGWQLQTGERVLNERTVELPDTFTVAGAGGSIPPIHWLYEVGLALVHRVGGLPGLAVLRIAMVLSLYGLLYGLATREGLPAGIAAAATSAAAAASWVQLVLRPQLVSMTFTVLLVGLLLEGRRRPRFVVWIPPLFALWANLHPGAILGLGVLAAFLAGEFLRTIAAPRWHGHPVEDAGRRIFQSASLAAGSALATLASPSGVQLWSWMWDHRTLFARRRIGELAPFDPSLGIDQLNLAIAMTLVVVGGRRLWRDPACWLPVAFFAVLAAGTTRFSPYVQHLLVLALAATWSPALPASSWRWLRNAAAVALAAVAAWGAFSVARAPHPLLHSFSHVPGAADFLVARHTPEPLYNSNRIGGYLIYRLAGVRRVFWSGRPTLFEDLWGLGFDAIDERFEFGTLVLADGDAPYAADTPHGDDRWRLVYFDDYARIYVDVHADGGAWGEQGFRHVRLRAGRPRHPGLEPSIGDARAALAELAPQHARDPDGYYTNLAVARAHLALEQRDQARNAVERALAARDTPVARSVRAAAMR